MTLVNAQETKRKFYNKWLYKISVRNSGAGMLRRVPLSSIEKICNNPYTSGYRHYSVNVFEQQSLIKIAELLMSESRENWAIRIESSTVDIYTNNKDFYNKIGTDLPQVVFCRFEPDVNKLDILNKNKNIITKKLPHNRYRYKVYLRPHELKDDSVSKIDMMNWIQNKNPQIKCTDSTRSWFINTTWNWDRRYMLVEDEPQLLMLKMRCGNSLGAVYQYVIADK